MMDFNLLGYEEKFLKTISNELDIVLRSGFWSGGENVKKIDVSILGKYKTAFQILSLFLILIGSIYLDLQPLLNIGIYLFWLSTIITLISAYQYYKSIF